MGKLLFDRHNLPIAECGMKAARMSDALQPKGTLFLPGKK